MTQLKKNWFRLGLILPALLGASSALAQTASTTTPGVPTTALGGDWTTNTLLIVLALAVIALGAMLYREKKTE
jgi:hypothetical protein